MATKRHSGVNGDGPEKEGLMKDVSGLTDDGISMNLLCGLSKHNR